MGPVWGLRVTPGSLAVGAHLWELKVTPEFPVEGAGPQGPSGGWPRTCSQVLWEHVASAAVTKESWSPSPFWLVPSHLKCPHMFPGTAPKPNIPAEPRQHRHRHHQRPHLLLGALVSYPRHWDPILGPAGHWDPVLAHVGHWNPHCHVLMCVSLCPCGVPTVALNAPSPCPHGVPAVAVRALSPCPVCAPCPCRSSHAWGSATRSTRGGRGARC